MRILEPNTGKEIVAIGLHHIYIQAKDTGRTLFLKEIKIGPAQCTWEWVDFRSDRFVDLSGISDRYCSFDNAINRSVNDLYCTVYEFKTFDEVASNWDNIKYADNITTVYRQRGKTL